MYIDRYLSIYMTEWANWVLRYRHVYRKVPIYIHMTGWPILKWLSFEVPPIYVHDWYIYINDLHDWWVIWQMTNQSSQQSFSWVILKSHSHESFSWVISYESWANWLIIYGSWLIYLYIRLTTERKHVGEEFWGARLFQDRPIFCVAPSPCLQIGKEGEMYRTEIKVRRVQEIISNDCERANCVCVCVYVSLPLSLYQDNTCADHQWWSLISW